MNIRIVDPSQPCSCDTETEMCAERKQAVARLHEAILSGASAEDALWQTILAYQGFSFCTMSGLPFSYMIKRRKDGEYSGELLISRKEGGKTLTRSSVMLAFHTVLELIGSTEEMDETGAVVQKLVPASYKGPKAIGQIFGISYIYSLFCQWNLIWTPQKSEKC